MLPLILVTNDDGVHSPGLHAALSAVHDLGDLLIVAPTEQQSGMSRSLPAYCDGLLHAIELEHDGLRLPAYHINGSPAQAVLYAVIDLSERKPDLVISGINYGENLGGSTFVSGTVGAALQAGEMGMRALAISLETQKDYHYNHGSDVDWSAATYWLRHFVRHLLTLEEWPDDVAALKIDLPDSSTRHTAWRMTRQSRQPYYRTQRRGVGDAMALGYEIAIDFEHLEPDSDIYAFAVDRVISVTPLSVNLTARVPLPQVEDLLRAGQPR